MVARASSRASLASAVSWEVADPILRSLGTLGLDTCLFDLEHVFSDAALIEGATLG
jgi:hypothetical protein